MSRKSLPGWFAAGAVFLLVPCLLFADGILQLGSGFLGFIIREIAGVCRDESTQWMLVVCLAVYVALFLFLEIQRGKATPLPVGSADFAETEREKKAGQLLLATFILLCLIRYAWNYSAAVKSLQVPVLLAGIVFGKTIASWVNWGERFAPRAPQVATNLPNGAKGVMRPNRVVTFIGWLIVLLASAAWYQQPKADAKFFYHSVLRWCGVWDNPNLYGLLMGVGAVLAFGSGLRGLRVDNRGWKRNLTVIFFFACAAVCAFGLFKSYSRGGWLGGVIGLLYSFRHPSPVTHHPSLIAWLRKNRAALLTLLFSLAVAGFWQMRFTEFLPAQRIASVGNPNDFSWRNRVTAWQGAARMLVARPLIGFGWGEAEVAFAKDYRSPRMKEMAAIRMNDYLMLGISAGVPAMLCFAGYVALAFRKKETAGTCCPTLICRAAVVVLLVGFWFDGVLFKLPVAAVFWVLLELVGAHRSACAAALQSEDGAQGTDAPHLSAKGNRWLRPLAILAALAAAGFSAIHLVTPRLAVSNGTLAVARKFLAHPRELKNFEWLTVQPIWRAQKLKTLLDHAELATYNRTLVNWQVDEKMFQDFVLSPVIKGTPDEKLDWRRPLWEEYYPQIRHESSLEDAAKIVLRQLRETSSAGATPEAIIVAALRSVGIPARLNDQENAEFWNGEKWIAPPRGNQ